MYFVEGAEGEVTILENWHALLVDMVRVPKSEDMLGNKKH